ncbi:uncharacterized protein FOMMEDRAFT_92706, partial [Fomitiporia mediterranea MF3/22]|uniref:uncharacterized protein n=1 Tax=Fomitiporia mediterranea (strain MF3/22) TaxID=694068 RepID=UPI0004409226
SAGFDGEDVPLAMKTDAKSVRMIVEESVRYDQASPEGSREWRYTAHPLGSGVVHLGPRHRSLFVNMFHQLHCIEYFAENLVRAHDGEREHLQHCLDFMRIMTLCRPDLTLELEDFSRRNFTSERTGAEHVCRDWTPAYNKATESYLAWRKIRDEQTSREGND